METNNSLLSFRASIGEVCLVITSELYRDIAECYNVTPAVQRTEIAVMRTRYLAEGVSFFTKTLPLMGKSLDKALSSGDRLSIIGWRKLASDSSIPKFIGWLISRVFSTNGLERHDADPVALAHIRQFCTLWYKLEIPYDEETENKVLTSFVETDDQLPAAGSDCRVNHLADRYCPRTGRLWSDDWLEKARGLITRVTSAFDPTGDLIVPRHGPGAVATGEKTLKKSNLRRVYRKLEEIYPFTEWMMFSLNHVASDSPDRNPRIVSMERATAKVTLVPKDSRGPRLISCEPLEIQWIQQGISRGLIDHIERHRLTNGHVNFTDQEINRRLAMQGSKDGQWVTLDMKDASDRVSLELINHLFQDHPRLLEALLASRSESTKLPCGTVKDLRKFAPMGSALCFPVEALVFWALAVSAIRCSGQPWAHALGTVYIYGDDLIVRKEDYTTVLAALPIVGLKFNDAKCCVAGSFRESCGCDAYKGVDVTPVKLKTTWSSTKDPKVIQSYCAFSNAMYGRGYFRVANLVRHELLQPVYGTIPFTDDYTISSNGAFVSQAAGCMLVAHEPAHRLNRQLKVRTRLNLDTHRLEYLTWGVVPNKVSIPKASRGYQEMLRRYSDGYPERGWEYAVARSNRLKRAWSPLW